MAARIVDSGYQHNTAMVIVQKVIVKHETKRPDYTGRFARLTFSNYHSINGCRYCGHDPAKSWMQGGAG